jgi:hypothetical protein
MRADIEVRIVNPDRTATAERGSDQPLAKPRDGREALSYQLADTGQIDAGSTVKQQDHCELLRNLARVHGKERPVGGARTLKHRFRARRWLAGRAMVPGN